MRRPSLILFGLLLFLAIAFGQTDSQQKFKVFGTVVNSATGQPVRGAMVRINGPDGRSTMCGNDGRFEMDDVKPGEAFITAIRPGFIPDRIQQQHVTVGPDMDSLVLKLDPLSSISGQIVDTDGEPIDGMSIQCLHESIVEGRKQWQPANAASTDETGHFLIEDVQAGMYILRTQQKVLYNAASSKSEASRYMYPTAYYPDAITKDLAQHVEVGPGQDLKVDMSLRAVRAARVTLTTVPPLSFVMASVTNGDDQGQMSPAQLNKATGSLILPAVPPGAWNVVLRGPFGGSEGPPSMFGEIAIEVKSADIDNLKVPMYPLQDISVIESGGSSNIRLVSEQQQMAFGENGQNGNSKITNVQPGTYRVVATPAVKGCITSLTSGSQNLLREQLVVSQGASTPPIQVVQSETCPTLTINVNSKAPAIVIVTNFAQAFEAQPVVLSGGSTSLTNLAPGQYSVFAFDDITDLEFADSEAMRNFKSQTVQLESGQETSVQLEMNERRTK